MFRISSYSLLRLPCWRSAARNDLALCDAFLRDLLNICHASSVREAGSALDCCIFSVVLTATDLRDGTWASVLHIARCLKTGPRIIVIEGFSDALSWTDKFSNGASDVVRRPLASLKSRAPSANRRRVGAGGWRRMRRVLHIQPLASATPHQRPTLPWRWTSSEIGS